MDYNIQTLQGVKSLVLVSLDECLSIARIDASSISSRTIKYEKENLFSYYVLLNTWGHLICTSSSEEAWVYIKIRIDKLGLLPVIRDCSDLADQIIHGEAPDWDYTYGYLSVMAKRDYSHADPYLQDILQILRFPKRFSPKFADIIQTDSLRKFLELNTAVKAANVVEAPWYWVSYIRQKVHLFLDGFSYEEENGYFSGGTSATTDKLLLSKIKQYASTESCIAHQVQFALSPASGYYPRWRDTEKLRETVVVQAVPKSYKAARIIAKEPPQSAFFLQAIARGVIDTVARNGFSKVPKGTVAKHRFSNVIDTSDQDRSCELCRIGSLDGSYATIDLTSASDSIGETFARSVLPQSFISACEPYRCAYLTAGKEKRLMQMFATSGSPLTFPVETVIFAAIAWVATETTERWLGEELLPFRVYGDDIIIDDRACNLCVQILEAVGCFPNLGKSFSGSTPLGYYRESCGAEYLNGMAMDTRYFSRKTLSVNAEGIAAVCDLQHRLYDNWKVRMFLSLVVKALEPRMTAHPVFSPCDDLWDAMAFPAQEVNKYNTDHGKRFKYLSLRTVRAVTSLKPEEVALLEMWYYYLYLLEGPLYASPLDKILGVSTSRRRLAADSSAAVSRWTMSVE